MFSQIIKDVICYLKLKLKNLNIRKLLDVCMQDFCSLHKIIFSYTNIYQRRKIEETSIKEEMSLPVGGGSRMQPVTSAGTLPG